MKQSVLTGFCALVLGILLAIGSVHPQLVKMPNNFSSIGFIANEGQWHKDVLFQLKNGAQIVWFTSDGYYHQYDLDPASTLYEANPIDPALLIEQTEIESKVSRLRIAFVGINKNCKISGKNARKGKINFFVGSNPDKWRSSVNCYEEIYYKNIFHNIDLRFYLSQSTLKSDYIVHPGGNVADIRLKYTGADSCYIDKSGNLNVLVGNCNISEQRPIVYQTYNGSNKFIDAHYILNENYTVKMQLDQEYDGTIPLIIDPELTYSSYLGGAEHDVGFDIFVDDSNYAYITGYARSTEFPLTSVLLDTLDGSPQAFVTKLNLETNEIVYSTIMGGAGLEVGYDIFVDGNGNAIVTGKSVSASFLGVVNLGGLAGFLVKLSEDGSTILHVELIDSPGDDVTWGAVMDSAGNIFAAGHTTGNLDGNINSGGKDIFVIKWDSSLTKQFTSVYGDSADDWGRAVAVNNSGEVFVTGYTKSDLGGNLNQGDWDIFLTKFDSTGSYLFTKLLGGPKQDQAQGITVDKNNHVWTVGYTENSLEGNQLKGVMDAVISKWDSTGNLLFTKFLGGSQEDRCYNILTDDSGNVYVTGMTDSPDFPSVLAFQTTHGGQFDTFVTKFSSDGKRIYYSSLYGGDGTERFLRLNLQSNDDLYLCGFTTSTNLVTVSAYQSAIGKIGRSDCLLTRVSPLDICCAGNRGDYNGDWIDANILDLTFLVDLIFRGSGDPGPCDEESDINNDSNQANILDLTFLVDFIFRGGPNPAVCP